MLNISTYFVGYPADTIVLDSGPIKIVLTVIIIYCLNSNTHRKVDIMLNIF